MERSSQELTLTLSADIQPIATLAEQGWHVRRPSVLQRGIRGRVLY